MKNLLTILLLSCTLPLLAQEWTFENTRSDWTDSSMLTVAETPDGLEITSTALHPNLHAPQVDFAPEGKNFLVVEYEATAPETPIGGGFAFFGTSDDPMLDEEKKFYLPQLIVDGKPHRMVVDLQGKARANAFAIWSNATAITTLRLDFEPQPGTTMLVRSIQFLKLDEDKALAELHPEEFAKGIPLRMPVDMPNAGDRKPEAAVPGVNAFFSPMVSPAPSFYYVGPCHLRKRFHLDGKPSQALWQSICDDEIEVAWLNGHKLERRWSDLWRNPDVFDVPPGFFVEGENLLAIRYQNTGDIGGLMMDLQIAREDGQIQVVTPEDSRSLAGEAPDGWERRDFDDGAWAKAATRPGPPAAPWTSLRPAYRSLKGKDGAPVRVKVVANDILSMDVLFMEPEDGFTPNERFYAHFCSPSGQVLKAFEGTAGELQGTTTEDGILFRFKAFESDYYGTPAHFQWVFGMTDRRQLLGMTKVDVVTEERAMEGEPAVSKVAQTPRGPIPMLNGKPFFFNILTACTSTMDNHYFVTGMEGADSPFNVVAARLGGMTNLWWVGPDQYDFTEVDRTLNSILQHYPDSMLGLYVWCQPGGWYGRMYPERMSHMEDGSIYGYYVSAIDFANAEYHADAARALTALMNHLETFFGPKTFIYNLMGGISCEWQGWASHSDQYADFSQGGTREFLEYAAQNGVNATAVPGRQEREATVDGIFRNPARDEIAILYDRYYSESIAECVEILAAAAKKACGRNKLVGCYYGYLMEYANLGHCVNGGGHNALQRLLDCPDLDYFLSPQSYGIRSLGAPNADMKPYGAIFNAGKFSMMEDDTRTHLTFKTDFEQTLNMECTLNVLKRNVGMSLAHATPLNQLPLVGGNELDDPAIRQLFTRSLQAGQYLMENGSSPSAEVAAVIDEDAIRYFGATTSAVAVKDRSRYMYSHDGALRTQPRYVQRISGDLLYYQRIPLAQFGAPVDVVLLEDILRCPAKYKMVIFLNAVKDKPELRQAIQALRDNGAIMVFTYGTGFLDDQGISTKTLSENVGMEMAEAGEGSLNILFDREKDQEAGHPYTVKTRFKVVDKEATPLARYVSTGEVAVAEKDGAYFYGTTDLDREFLRHVAQNAGVHVFIDGDDNLYASRDVVSIHANHAGRKTIRLPQICDVVDVFSGEVVAREANSFEITMDAFETRVFLTGNAEKILGRE